MKTAFEIASEWYTVDEVHWSVVEHKAVLGSSIAVPPDVTSREFAEWLTDQYRLAMAKGIQIGRGQFENE